MINENTTLYDLYNDVSLSEIKDCLIAGGENFFLGETGKLSLKEFNEKVQPTWGYADMLTGIFGVRDAFARGGKVIPVYGEKEIESDEDKRKVKLVFFPAKNKKRKTAFIASGGAYGSVCNLAEGFPIATVLAENGYDCFCLRYRTATPESFISGLLPKPMEDFAAAIRLIASCADDLNVNMNDYSVCGFSAGGHLCASMACENIGLKKYGLKNPAKVILAYPLVDLKDLTGKIGAYMLTGLFGKNFDNRLIDGYSPLEHLSDKYPETFIVQANDDNTVNPIKSAAFVERLNSLGVSAKLKTAEKGGHGFGLGSNTDLCGWLGEAFDF